MKKLIAAATLACATAFGSAASAQTVDITKMNPNAVAETLVRTVLSDAGQSQKSNRYVDPAASSLVCIGKIPLDKTIQTFDGKGPRTYPFQSELGRFINDPDATDKAAQASLRDAVTKRSDLVYIEYVSVFGPNANAINAYFTKMGGKPIDSYVGGTGMRDGSMRATILLDQGTFNKFVSANGKAVAQTNAAYTADKLNTQHWTACGPAR